MSTNNIRGRVAKQSRLGLTWNARYLIVDNNQINIYKSKKECNKNSKYSFNVMESKMEKINEQSNEIKVEVTLNDNKTYRFLISKDLWKLLDEFYTNAHNTNTPQNNNQDQEMQQNKEITESTSQQHEDDNEEHETEDTTTNQEITQSKEIVVRTDSNEDHILNDSANDEVLNDPLKEEDTLDDSSKKEILNQAHKVDISHQNVENIIVANRDIFEEIDAIVEENATNKYEWNGKYRNMLDNDQENVNTKALISEFCSISKMHCIDIIENIIFVHNETNVNLDELQEVFVRDDIEFKIITSENEYHQIKSLITNFKKYEEAFDGIVPRLYCPLCCIIEYTNHKVYCKASLPSMTEENLVFGKALLDTSFKSNDTISELLDQAAEKLNLASHGCKYDEKIQISTSSNIRVHETENNVYYIDNISELYPIDIVHFMKHMRKPDRKISEISTVIHPNLVKMSSDPVSSDAFIPPNDDKQDQIASKSIYNLHSNIIPKFVENINHLKVKIADSNTLQRLMIKRGISMIYIGELYNLCTVRYAKEIIGILMIAQTIKEEMNQELITSKDEYEEKVNYYINCFTNDDDSYIIELGIKEKIISLTNYNLGTCLNSQRLNKFPFKFVQSELERILNVTKTIKNDKEKQINYTFNCNIFASVCDKYIDNIDDTSCNGNDNNIASIQRQWLKVQNTKDDITDCAKFDQYRVRCLSLMNKIDLFFPFHFLKFDVMFTMIGVYSNIIKKQNKEELVDYCCSLYSDCYDLSTFLFGATHRQTLLVNIQLIKLLYTNNKETDSVEILEDVLKSIYDVFGKTSLNSVIVLKLLSDKYFENGNYQKAIHYTKQHIFILDEKKRFNNDEYTGAHLRVSSIAEKLDDYLLGIRFLNKLYNNLKKYIEKDNKQKLFENIDIKLLALSISRLKMKMSNKQKLNEMKKQWKTFHENKANGDYSMDEYNKCKELIIQNLCLNPIKKSNDLLKSNAEMLQVICWINIIKEFEIIFLQIKE